MVGGSSPTKKQLGTQHCRLQAAWLRGNPTGARQSRPAHQRPGNTRSAEFFWKASWLGRRYGEPSFGYSPAPATSDTPWLDHLTTTEMPTAPRGYVKILFCTTSQTAANSQLPDHACSRSGSPPGRHPWMLLHPAEQAQVQPHPRDQPDQPSCVTACQASQAHVHLPGPFQLQELRRRTKTRLAAPTSAVANHLVVVSHDRQARYSQGSKTKKANSLSTDRRVRRQKNLKLASGAPDRNPGASPTPPAPSRGRHLLGLRIVSQ